jgi:cytoskeletal protein CcmA (bactofilin family)
LEQKATYLAPGTEFEGTITAPGDVMVDGEVRGEIISEGKVSVHKMGDASIAARDLELLGAVIKGDIIVGGEVTVDAESAVKGNIRSAGIVCEGVVEGNLVAAEYVELGAGARILGNITTPLMGTARGAKIRGQLIIGGEQTVDEQD